MMQKKKKTRNRNSFLNNLLRYLKSYKFWLFSTRPSFLNSQIMTPTNNPTLGLGNVAEYNVFVLLVLVSTREREEEEEEIREKRRRTA